MSTPLPTPPDWAGLAAAELDRLNGKPHTGKMRATVLALVDVRLAGLPEERVWDRSLYPDACSRTIYQQKWKHQPLFASVLTNVEALARNYQDTRTLRALQSAAERLALASPVAVGRLIALMQDPESAIVLRAALGILDRAGVETAQKASSEISGKGGDAFEIVVRYEDEAGDFAAAPVALAGTGDA